MSRQTRLVPALALAALAAHALVGSPIAEAQYATGAPSAYRFYAAPGPGGFLGVDTATLGRPWTPSAELLVDWAHAPFELDEYDCLTNLTDDCPSGNTLPIVQGMVVAQITPAFTISDFLQIGLNVPVVLKTWGEGWHWDNPAPGQVRGGEATTLGDPRLHANARIYEMSLGRNTSLGFGAAAWVTFPVANLIWNATDEAYPGYAGDATVAAGGHAIVGFRWEGLRAAINLGGAYHDQTYLLESSRSSEMTYGVGAGYDFDDHWGIQAEVQGATTFGDVFDNEGPSEIRLAGTARVDDVVFTLGAGTALFYAIGVPVVRVLGGIAYEPTPARDNDGDGLVDHLDACPVEAEDVDGFTDDDGCPDLDDDSDGVPDATDRCREEGEDLDEHEDEDGCPEPDNDGDGVNDGFDSCPNDAEDRDGDHDDDGCPDGDTDRDHIPDARDRCVNEAEDTDGLADEDGCPETDADGDGINDEQDECADQAEDMDHYQDRDGCPEEEGGQTGRPAARPAQ